MYDELFDQVDTNVAARVQVELEKLNSSTNQINKLEVDLDEARHQFRQLLEESTIQIGNCAKKLGSCVVKVRPYYNARIQAIEALQETQKAAAKFERANSAHSAAKEMVFLAEEGLKTEGRTFDHAWQEMLNHATMRVNESESERTRCEADHKKTSQNYQMAEIKVNALQKELKRAITKSRPYFELRIHYNQLLEKQKGKIKNLEKQVAQVKVSYAHTLKNLEQISDEIHKTRRLSNKINQLDPRDSSSRMGSALNSPSDICAEWMNNNSLRLGSERPDIDERDSGKTAKNSHRDNKIHNKTSLNSENDSSFMNLPDMKSEKELFRLSKTFDRNVTPSSMIDAKAEITNLEEDEASNPRPDIITNLFSKKPNSLVVPVENEDFRTAKMSSFSNDKDSNFSDKNLENAKNTDEIASNSGWTEIKLHSPEKETFSTEKSFCATNTKNQPGEESGEVPYVPLTKHEEDFDGRGDLVKSKGNLIINERERKDEIQDVSCSLVNQNKSRVIEDKLISKSPKGTPKKLNFRRQSLDVIWNSNAGEKMKEILSQSILKLNIGSFTENKLNESKLCEEKSIIESDLIHDKGKNGTNEANCASQFGIKIFNRKNSKISNNNDFLNLEDKHKSDYQDSLSSNLEGCHLKKDKFFTKKIPNPLERTLNYLNADEESNSDSESLGSLDVLTDEQLSSLLLDKDLTEIYQDLI